MLVDEMKIECHPPQAEPQNVQRTDLLRVEIWTNDQGPWTCDVYWHMVGGHSEGLVPQGATGEGELLAAIQEVYWHINKVWNGRRRDQQDMDRANEAVFDALCDFPKDLELA